MNDVNGWKDFLAIALKEGKRHLLPLAALFATVAVLALVVGLMLPKRWDATTTIVIEANSPLGDNHASPAAITEHTALVMQVMGERRVLREVLTFGGFLRGKISPQEQVALMTRTKARIKIDVKEQTIKISYNDTDPQRAYRMTNKLAELFIRESRAIKTRASSEAFDFIDGRVKEYEDKLTDAQGKLLAYYHGQTNAPVVAPALAPTAPAGTPPAKSAAEIAALKIEEASLSEQLSRARGPAAPSAGESRQAEEQYRARVLQAQADLDRLLGTYTDQHPDVKRARNDLATAKEELRRTEQARVDLEKARAAATVLDDEVTREARARLENVQTRLTVLTGVRPRRAVSSSPRALADTLADPEMKGVGHDTVQSELLRKYEATRDVYQDLLKKREVARVARDLDAEQRGFAMRVEEEAEVPVTASSLRLLHLSLIGLVLATLIPLGVLVGLVRFDPRVRSPAQIERLARVPLLVAIPRPEVHRARTRFWTQGRLAMLMVGTVFFIYILVFAIRTKLT